MSEQNFIANTTGCPRTIAVSVVIPAFNEEIVIAKCLNSLVLQDFPVDSFEVIVVDNGSVDRTVEVAKSFEPSLHLTVVKKPKSTISALRNLGADIAKGEYLAFLDSDCVARPEWLSRAVELLRLGSAGVIGAFYTIPDDSSWVAKAWYADMHWVKHGRVSYVPAGTLFVSRSIFLQLGGFDVGIATSEDFEFCQRVGKAGCQVLAYPILSTVHLGTPQKLSAFYQKQLWHGTGVRTAFGRDMLDASFAKTIVFTLYWLFWLLVTVAAVPLALALHSLAVLFIAPAFLLVAAMALAARNAAERRNWTVFFPLVGLYITYGIARSMSFLGAEKRRAARRTFPATPEPHTRGANLDEGAE